MQADYTIKAYTSAMQRDVYAFCPLIGKTLRFSLKHRV